MFRLHFAISRLLPLTQNFSFLLCEAAAAAKKSDMTICHGVRMQKRIGKISFSFICVLDNPSLSAVFAMPTAVQSFGMQDAIRHIENHIRGAAIRSISHAN
jgi:hypothetical protein